jgi:RNA polymerase sigma-70 factor (ECF subfamily)
LQQNRSRDLTTVFDEEIHSGETDECNPETLIMRGADVKQLTKALEELPVEYREALVLRELEGLSYKEIADVADVPIGTVMSRLARARKRLQQSLTGTKRKEVQLGL